MELSNRQKDILLGTLLGDGCLEKNGRYVRLRIDHSGKQGEYVKWKYLAFRNIAANKPRLSEIYDRRTSKIYKHWRFDTQSLPCLEKHKSLFYRKGQKIVPMNISYLLKSRLTLAVWFMDDGYNRNDCSAMYFNTQAYSLNEQMLLQKCLKFNFGLMTKIHWAEQDDQRFIYLQKRASNYAT